MEPYAVGIDLGGTNIKVVAVDQEGRILAETSAETGDRPRVGAADGPSPWAVHIREQLAALESGPMGGVPAQWVGLAAPGLAARDNRSIAAMPGRLAGLEGLDWTEWLGRPRKVPVLNDAHAALLGEAWKGAAAGLSNVILLTLGTGVGGAILSDGRLFQGPHGRAGHFGHFCLNPDGPPDICNMPGSLETTIGESSLHARTNGRYPSTEALVAAHRQGDAAATAIWLKSVRALGCAIGSLVNVLDSEAAILGGGIAKAGPDLFDPLQKVLDEVEWRPCGYQVRVLPAELGSYAGALGAAHHAIESPELIRG